MLILTKIESDDDVIHNGELTVIDLMKLKFKSNFISWSAPQSATKMNSFDSPSDTYSIPRRDINSMKSKLEPFK